MFINVGFLIFKNFSCFVFAPSKVFIMLNQVIHINVDFCAIIQYKVNIRIIFSKHFFTLLKFDFNCLLAYNRISEGGFIL